MTTYLKYSTVGLESLLKNVVFSANPKTVLELGTGSGYSAALIGANLDPNAILITVDTFEDIRYSYEQADSYLKQADLPCGYSIIKSDAVQTCSGLTTDVDLAHIDLDNHYDNVRSVLECLKGRVKLVVLEGGIEYPWHRENNILPFTQLLEEDLVVENFDQLVTIDNNRALTILRSIT